MFMSSHLTRIPTSWDNLWSPLPSLASHTYGSIIFGYQNFNLASRVARRRPSVCAISIPGPLFLTNEDRPSWPSSFVPFPLRDEKSIKSTPPLVRVRLSVQYRVHSRQMLCVGGSSIPLGWSFLSIAKVPMTWTPEDVWMVDIELPAGTRIEYKYVILEEQDWTQQVNQSTEGKVEYTYRVSPDENPPDIRRITKQMAIVAWQAGPNRILQVPSESELAELRPGNIVRRGPLSGGFSAWNESSRGSGEASSSEQKSRVDPASPRRSSESSSGSSSMSRIPGQNLFGKLIGTQRSYGEKALGPAAFPPTNSTDTPPRPEEFVGIWEELSLDENGRAILERRDVWGQEVMLRSTE